MATARCNVPPEVLKRLHDIFENVQGISFDDILSFQTLQPVQCCVDRHVLFYWLLEEHEHISMATLGGR